MKRYCLPLELIAFAVHPGDTQSTTTACLDANFACLYLTSQNNFQFERVDLASVHNKIRHLAELTSKTTTVEQCKERYWKNHCSLYTYTSNAKDAEQKIQKIYDGLYTQLWKKFKAADYHVEELQTLQAMIRDVAVINDNDIFFKKTPEKTGFHGESRLVRFLFIRQYPGIHCAKTNSFFTLWPGETLSEETKVNARKWFGEHISSQLLAMGSSQGTCEGCAECLDEFKIAHGDVGNRPDQWLDPLTMGGYQGAAKITKDNSHHAIFVAFKYISIR